MNQPTKPMDPPSEGAAPDTNPTGDTPNGVPKEMDVNEAKAVPDSGRNASEQAHKPG